MAPFVDSGLAEGLVATVIEICAGSDSRPRAMVSMDSDNVQVFLAVVSVDPIDGTALSQGRFSKSASQEEMKK